MEKLKLLDLFSGIGGFSLGLERSGAFETVAFCEIEPFCRKVLKKHWPEVPQYGDIRGLSASQLELDGIRVDAICGGFPCQDISTAGKGAGLAGERSGLWFEFARLIGEIRPRYVIVENVSALLVRGLDAVLGSLAEIGYDAEWHCIPAWFVGAPHRRDRIWIVAHSNGQRCVERQPGSNRNTRKAQSRLGNGSENVAHADSARLSITIRSQLESIFEKNGTQQGSEFGERGSSLRGAWSTEPAVGRVAHGVPDMVDRLKSLGNAVAPPKSPN